MAFNLLERWIVAGYTPRTIELAGLVLGYDPGTFSLSATWEGKIREFDASRSPPEPWRIGPFMIHFSGQQCEDMPTMNGGREPNPFVEFYIKVEVPEGRLAESDASERAMVAAREFLGETAWHSTSRYDPSSDTWEIIAAISEPAFRMARVTLEAVGGNVKTCEEHRED